MSDIVIQAEKLSKRYRLGVRATHERTLGEMLYDTAGAVWAKVTGRAAKLHDHGEIWALRDVSFEVRRGEVLGIIGRNGAGKSTLLKILSRITDPTSGRAIVRGRVGSLLEVGTGFHPELTGRENIYLGGAVLGMSRREVAAKFNQIVEFADIGPYLDTPVKRYSSGMYVRLAFAVAAHLEPDILIVDEVLAVGDMEFQKKCLGRMRTAAAEEGRTVLFVSHNIMAMGDLCRRILWLDRGQVVTIGETRKTIRQYLEVQAKESTARLASATYPKKTLSWEAPARLIAVQTLDERNQPCSSFEIGQRIRLRVSIESRTEESLAVGISICDIVGRKILHFCNMFDDYRWVVCHGNHTIELSFPNVLNSGTYYLTLWLGNRGMKTYDYVDNCLKITSRCSDERASWLRGLAVIPGQWSQPNCKSDSSDTEGICEGVRHAA